MDIEEANAALAIISQSSSAIHQRSEQARAKFKDLHHAIFIWSNEQRQLDDQHADVCEHLCASNEADVAKLSNLLQRYHEAKSANSLDEMKFSQDMDDIVERLSGLARKNDVFPIEQRKLQQEISVKSERLEQRRAQADQLLRRNKRKHDKLSDTYTDYMQAFAVHVKTIDSTTMQFMFKKIKKADPEASFIVTVTVNGEKYSAASCTPRIPNFGQLAKELDVSNNLEPFLWAVRKGFQEVAAE